MSDWDLLVVVSDDATEDELDLMHAWQVVRDLRIPADVIPVRRSDFEEARDHAGTLVRTVVGEGRQVYARGEDVDIAPAPSAILALAAGSLADMAETDRAALTRRLHERDS